MGMGMNHFRQTFTPEEIWQKYDAMEQRLTAPVSERMLDLARLRTGMRVLDLATGRGEPAIRAAHQVGPMGAVMGTDISGDMLKMARERANREGLTNLILKVTSAETLEGIPTGHFQVALARWGLMYLDNPIAALQETRRALETGGILVAAVWAEPDRVPYFTLPRRALSKFAEVPSLDPERPGTFRFGNQEQVDRDFSRAGFFIENMEELDIPVMEAANDKELIEWARAFGMNRLLHGLSEDIQSFWEAELIKQAKPFRKDGVVSLGGVTRLVVAKSNRKDTNG